MLKKFSILFLIIAVCVTFIKCSSSTIEPNTEITRTFSNKTIMKISPMRNTSSKITFIKEKHEIPEEYIEQYPVPITEDERNEVLNYIRSIGNFKDWLNNNKSEYYRWTEIEQSIWGNQPFYIQFVGQASNEYTCKDQNGASHTYSNVGHMDYITFNGNHLPDYNTSGGPTLLTLTSTHSYGFTHKNSDSGLTNGNWRFYVINDNLYVGLDYELYKMDGSRITSDDICDDYVLKITPAIKSKEVVEEPVKKTSKEISITIPVDRKMFLEADDFAIRRDGQYVSDIVPVNNTVDRNGIIVEDACNITINNLEELDFTTTTEYTYEVWLWAKERQTWDEHLKDIIYSIPREFGVRYDVYKGTGGNISYIKVSIHITKNNA